MFDWLLKLIPHLYLFHANRKSDKEVADFFDYRIPHLLLKLVQQAQQFEEFDTDPKISVSADMREKLAYPLTAQQAMMIGSTDYIVEQDMIYSRIVSNWQFDGAHCAKIMVNIDYVDSKKGLDLHFHDIALTVKCSYNPKRGRAEVISVEHD